MAVHKTCRRCVVSQIDGAAIAMQNLLDQNESPANWKILSARAHHPRIWWADISKARTDSHSVPPSIPS